MEVNKTGEDAEIVEEVKTPDVLGKILEEAEKILKENGLDIVYETGNEDVDKKNIYVKEQTPKAGINVTKGSKIYLK